MALDNLLSAWELSLVALWSGMCVAGRVLVTVVKMPMIADSAASSSCRRYLSSNVGSLMMARVDGAFEH